MAKRLLLLASACLALAPSSAVACSIVVDHEPDYFERKAEAKRILSFATLIVDGEVVEPGAGTSPAKVKVAHVLRGPHVDYVMVGPGDSCDMKFEVKGERFRFVLQGGPDVYTTWVDNSYAPEIDRMLKSDRRKVWPYYNPAYPPKKRR